MKKTLYDKIWEAHIICEQFDNRSLIYIDRHFLNEVSSPQAFEGLALTGRSVRRPEQTVGVSDHVVPTIDRQLRIADPEARIQVATLTENCQRQGIRYFDLNDKRQGIVHIIGPEQGFTLPGMTLVCGDSHTSTHGAFGALAFGIGTSAVEHVLATQTLMLQKEKNMRIEINGQLAPGITAKDLMLAIIAKIGTAGATGHVIEYSGEVIKALSMEGRMTICNMSIEAGARAGLIAPDEKTFAYLKGRPMAPKDTLWEEAMAYWQTLQSDPDSYFDTEVLINAADIAPRVTWGTNPEMGLPINGHVPSPAEEKDAQKRAAIERALDYMGLSPSMKLTDIKIDRVFIGSCTNGRIEDLREVANLVKNKKVSPHVKAMIVPGSGLVKAEAEQEGLDKIFINAGFEWREPGCSMCMAMNADRLEPGERCASTSNRNFEGRQGRGGRTHLMSPAMAAAAAITGYLTDIRSFK